MGTIDERDEQRVRYAQSARGRPQPEIRKTESPPPIGKNGVAPRVAEAEPHFRVRHGHPAFIHHAAGDHATLGLNDRGRCLHCAPTRVRFREHRAPSSARARLLPIHEQEDLAGNKQRREKKDSADHWCT